LILRDLDILKKLSKENLVRVALSITTLDEGLRKKLEPRTTSVNMRLKALEVLAKNGIPTRVMFAPIIPGLNGHELLPMAEKTHQLGAQKFGYTIVRLNDEVAEIFEDWIAKAFPDRQEKVLNQIREMRGGNLGEKRFKRRMVGEGPFSEMIRQQYQLVKMKYFNGELPKMNVELHANFKDNQLKLF
jgi:DNA repair photolyase